MQGFILHVSKYKDEDSIVTILTPESLLTLYRFYGARHSTVNLGHKIDFEVENIVNISISRLRHIIHLGTPWQAHTPTVMVWHRFIKLLNTHLRGIDVIEAFYFDLLERLSRALERQNPKRACIDAYLELLEYEGRLHREPVCFICDEPVEEHLALGRAFLPAHTSCIYGRRLPLKETMIMLRDKKSLLLDETSVENIWEVLQEGM